MVGTTLGAAYVQIVPSAQGIKGSITNLLGGEAKTAGATSGKSLGANIVSFAKKAIIAGAIGKTVKAALNEGAALQQSYLGGLDTLYGDAADKAREYARAAQEAGISMNDFSEQAVSFGAALKSAYGGDATKAIEAANTAIMDMADNSAKMGTDIESVQMAYQGFAKQNYTMLDNLKLGYGGTKTEMQRLLADAEALTGVHYDIGNLGDVYDAIHVIQGELGLTGVAAEEASQTFSGSFNAMKAAAQNFLGSLTLGQGVSEAMSQLATSASTFFFGNFLPMIGTLIKSLPAAIGTFLQEGVPLLLEQISALISSLASSITSLAKGMTSETVSAWVTGTLPKLLSAAGKMLGQFAKGLLSNLPKIVAAIAKIGAAIVKGLGSALWGKVKAAAEGIKDRFLAPIEKAKDKIKSILDKIKGFFPLSVGKIFSGLKLPHFSVSGGQAPWGIGGKGSMPSFSVSWYKKAEAAPYMFKGATLFGAGEAGDEVLYGRDALMSDIKEATSGGNTFNITLNANGSENPEQFAQRFTRELKRQVRMGAI